MDILSAVLTVERKAYVKADKLVFLKELKMVGL